MQQTTKTRVKEWADEDKPREKLIQNGKKTLSNAELMAILLGSGSLEQNVIELSKSILNSVDNSLVALSRLSIGELTRQYKGIGQAKAVTIIAALELGYRMLSEKNAQEETIIHSSQDLLDCFAPKLIDQQHEEFWVLYLNTRNRVLGIRKLSEGGLTETLVDIRLLIRGALEANAVAIAVAHNHPSGSTQPSREDKQLTERIKNACNLLNIKLVDHLIVGIDSSKSFGYYSFYDEGNL